MGPNAAKEAGRAVSDLALNLIGMTIGAVVVGGSYWWTKRRQPCPHRRVIVRAPEPGSEVVSIECVDCNAAGRGVPVGPWRDGGPSDYRHEWELERDKTGGRGERGA